MPRSRSRLDEIERIVIETQEPGVRIIDKTGPLTNPADRDHCIQYMVAVPLIFGRLTAVGLRGRGRRAIRASTRCARRMQVVENRDFTRDYYDPAKRFIGNAVQVFFTRRQLHASGLRSTIRSGIACGAPKALPLLRQKFEAGVRGHFGADAGRADPAAVCRSRGA